MDERNRFKPPGYLPNLFFVGAVCCSASPSGVQIPVTRSITKRAPYGVLFLLEKVMDARNRFKPPGYLPNLFFVGAVCCSASPSGVQIPVTRSKVKGCRLGILFLFSSFLTHTRLSSTYNDSGDGIPAPLLHL